MLLRLLNQLLRSRSSATPEPTDESIESWLQRGRALEKAGKLGEALDCFRACGDAHPDAVNAHLGAAAVLAALWRTDEAFQALCRAHEAAPHSPEIYGDLLLWSHLVTDPDPREIYERHRAFGDAIAAAIPRTYAGGYTSTPDPERRLRVGYISRNFLRHSVGFFIEPVIASHERSGYEVYCYYTHTVVDETTERIASRADVWRHVPGDDDEALAKRVHDDAIDILVDLTGHTKQNRLGVFAREPAPVQMTWMGYPDTTGVKSIGYRITDALADPAPDAEALNTERLLRVGPPFLCYQPPLDAPPVNEREVKAATVFGSFNMLAKVNVRAVDVWSRILHAVGGSRLVLKSSALSNDETAARVRAVFAAHGVEPQRIELRGWESERANHLAAYGDIDVALDTLPYNGTTTTCEALWMGVPVITLRGEMHMARVGATLLHAVGLPDCVASTPDEYVDAAVALAHDRLRCQALRAGMRRRLEASPLLAHIGFTRELEQAYRGAWRRFCAR